MAGSLPARFETPISRLDSFLWGISCDTSDKRLQKMMELFRVAMSGDISVVSGSPETDDILSMGAERVVMYADTLDAYNLHILHEEKTLEEMRAEARAAGDRRLESQVFVDLIEAVGVRQIVRWDELLEDDFYPECLQRISELYVARADNRSELKELMKQGDEEARFKFLFSERVDALVGNFVKKRISSYKKNPPRPGFVMPHDHAVRCVRAYLLEECAVQLVLAERYCPKYVLYNGKINDAFAALQEFIFADKYPGRMEWNEIRVSQRPIKQVVEGATRKRGYRERSTSSEYQGEGDVGVAAAGAVGGGGGGAGGGASSERLGHLFDHGLFAIADSKRARGGAGMSSREDGVCFDRRTVKKLATDVTEKELDLNGLFAQFHDATTKAYVKLAKGEVLSKMEEDILHKVRKYMTAIEKLAEQAVGRSDDAAVDEDDLRREGGTYGDR